MKRTNTQLLSDVLLDFLSENPFLAKKMAETRLVNSWSKILGSSTSQYTKNLYVKNKTLYVFLSSAVLRSELNLCRERLVKKLNDEAGMEIITDIVLA